MQFIDLKSQFERVEEDVRRRMDEVLAHGQYIMGPEVAELEQELARFAGVRRCVSCGSGTDALLMALMAWGIGPGDAVFTTPFTFVATVETIALVGAVPVLVDIDPDTFNMDPEKLERAITALAEGDRGKHPLPMPALEREVSPRAIIPVDLFGMSADYDAINRIAVASGLHVLGDAAQSFGATCKGRRSTALADASATSFFPAKPLGCYGDGGAIFTDDPVLAEALVSIRIHGQGANKYENVRLGINGRMDTLQAAVLLAKLAVFPDEIEARNRVAAAYGERLSGLDGLDVPTVPEGYESVWAQYTLKSPRRGDLRTALARESVPTAIYYPTPIHLQPGYRYLGYRMGDMPVAEKAAGLVFSLPMHPYLGEEEIEKVAAPLVKALSG